VKCGVKHSCYYVCFEVAAFDSKPEVLHKQNVVLLENSECLLSELAYKYMNQNKASKNSLLSNAHNNIPQNQWKIIAAQKEKKNNTKKTKQNKKQKTKNSEISHNEGKRNILLHLLFSSWRYYAADVIVHRDCGEDDLYVPDSCFTVTC